MEVLHSCRCCLQRAPDKDLTTPYIYLGATEIYSDMLIECFDINVTLGTDSECGICEVCVGRLRDASDFKLQVQRSQAELQGVLQVIDAKPALKLEIATSGDILYEEPTLMSELSDDAASDICASQPSHGRSRGGGGRGDHTYVKTECLRAAVSINGATDEGSELDPASTRERLAVACFERRMRLRSDKAPHARQTWRATSRRRPKPATSMKDMPDDTAGLRAEEQAYTCDTCGEHFTDESRLSEHVQVHVTQADKLYITHSCKKHDQATGAQRTQKNLNMHKKTHPSDTSYACNICKKQFTEKRYLTIHMRRHDKPKSTYRKRQPNQTRGKRYTCNVCEKQFKYIFYLDRHLRTHTGQKPYMCDACGKTFADSSTLRRHRQTHTGIQPYTCNICSKKFTFKGVLVRHVKIHTEHKPYTCDVCSKTFGDRTHLEIHKYTHTSHKPYMCEICGMQFLKNKDMTIHIKKHT